VFNFLTIKDADDIAACIECGQKALVIGGGLIGVSVTEALQKRRLDVTIIEMKNRVLNTILDEESSSIVAHTLKEAGVKIITNHTVSGIIGDTVVQGIVLDNGEEIPCNLVILAIGVTPRVELAIGAEIKVNRGIAVDRFMATNVPNIFACGDVAEAYDFIDDSYRVIPVWPNAYMGGRIAGNNMAGVRTEYSGGTAMNSLNYFGIDIATAGIITTPDNKQYETIKKRDNGNYKKLILNNNYVVGMVYIRDIEKSGIIFSLMRERVDVSSFKKELLSDNFGLAYLPKQVWRERLGTSLLDIPAPCTKPDEKVGPLISEQRPTGALK
jgi:nitrite reductase (NADH) large subunit